MPTINFLSDFGVADEFVGVVHGVIARVAPEVRVIDVTHGVPRGNVRAGALALLRAVQYLPDGVFLAVVDPGVGTPRKAIAAATAVGVFVGPDNGLLSPAVALVGGATSIVSIENPEFRIPSHGSTFQGRDVFAPAAASLANGDATIDDLGPVLDSTQSLLLPLPEAGEGVVSGEVWWVDGYGNAETNITPEDLESQGLHPGAVIEIRVGAQTRDVPWVSAFADVDPGQPLAHVDSAGLISIAVRGGSAASQFALSDGTGIRVASPGPKRAK